MSEFKILVEAEVDISKIKKQLSEKMSAITIAPNIDKRSVSTSAKDVADNVSKTINRELRNRITDIKFTADTGDVRGAIAKINSALSGIDMSKLSSDQVPTYQKHVSELTRLLTRYNKEINSTTQVSRNLVSANAAASSSFSKLVNSIKANELSVTSKYLGGTLDDVQEAKKMASEMAENYQTMIDMRKSAGKTSTDNEVIALEKARQKMIRLENSYSAEVIRIKKTTTDKVITETNRAFKAGEITSEQAIQNMKDDMAKYVSAYEVGMGALQTGAVFKDLTNEQKEAIIQTQKLQKAMIGVQQSTEKATMTAGEFSQALSKFVSIRFIVYALWQSFKDGLVTLKEIDDTLVGIRKVTDMSADSAARLAREASNFVSEFGRSTQDYLKAYEVFSKAGYDQGQSKNMTELSLLLQNVGDLEAEVANQTLIAANAGFQLNGSYEALLHTIDAMNNISNNNATTIGKMSEAIKVSSSVAQVAGFSFDEYMSIIGAATTATQREGSEIGRAVRTIVANIRQINDAEAEVDEDSYGKAGKSLESIAGISVKVNGELRNTMDVLTELAGKWDILSSVQKSQLANDIANKRQMDVFLSLMENWNTVEKQLEEAVNSTGSAIQENEIYLDSITAKTNEFKNAVTSMWLNSIDSKTVKLFVEFGTTLIKIIDNIGAMWLAFGLLAGSAAKNGTLINKLFTSVVDIISNGVNDVKIFGEAIKTAAKNGSLSLSELKKSFTTNIEAANALKSILLTGVIVALGLIITYAQKAYAESRALFNNAVESSQTIVDQNKALSDLIEEYRNLSDTQVKTLSDMDRLNALQKEINDKVESASGVVKEYEERQKAVSGEIDSVTTSINTQTTALEKNEEAIQKVIDANNDKWLIENAYAVDQAQKVVSGGLGDYANSLGFLGEMSFYFGDEAKNVGRAMQVALGEQLTYAELMEYSFEDVVKTLEETILAHNNGTRKLSSDTFKAVQSARNWAAEVLKDSEGLVEQQNKILSNGSFTDSFVERNTALTEEERAARAAAEAERALGEAISDVSTQMDAISAKANVLADAYATMADGEELSYSQMQGLLDSFPELVEYYDTTTGKLIIQEDQLKKLLDAQVNLARTTVRSEADKLRNSDIFTTGVLKNYRDQIDGAKAVTQAQIDMMRATIMSDYMANGSDPTSASFNAQYDMKGVTSQISSLNTAIAELDKLLLGVSASTYKATSTAGKATSTVAEKTKNAFAAIRDDIENAFEIGSISAIEALDRIKAEIDRVKVSYDVIMRKASDTWTDLEKEVVAHYRSLISLQEQYLNTIRQQYDDARSLVEDIQGRLVEALRTKYEEERDSALEAIEAQRSAREEAFDERIEQLEAEKAALEDTREEDEINLETLKRKLELSRLDQSVFGKKRTAELEAQVKELEKDLKIRNLEAEIEEIQQEKDDMNESYDQQIAETEKYYDKLLDEASLYAKANKLIISNNIKEMTKLISKYAPDFRNLGALLGKSLSDSLKDQLAGLDDAMARLSQGLPTGYSGTGSGGDVGGGSSIPWDGKYYKYGSSGDTVRRIQKNLIDQGFSVGAAGADGIFGNATLSAIKAFQKAMGLAVDGIVGPDTWAKLIKFDTGGIPVIQGLATQKDGALAMVHKKERILTDKQTLAFDQLVYNMLPDLMRKLAATNSNNVASVINYNINMNNEFVNKTPFDVNNNNDNLARQIKKQINSLGMRGSV